MGFFVYILANWPDAPMYVGMTDDLTGRVWRHREHVRKGFTDDYRIERLVWHELHDPHESAFVRERRIKRWRREWKNRLVREMNPTLGRSLFRPVLIPLIPAKAGTSTLSTHLSAALPPAIGARLGALALLLLLEMVADGAAAQCADGGVAAGEVPGHAADEGASEAAGLGGGRSGQAHGEGGEKSDAAHGRSPTGRTRLQRANARADHRSQPRPRTRRSSGRTTLTATIAGVSA